MTSSTSKMSPAEHDLLKMGSGSFEECASKESFSSIFRSMVPTAHGRSDSSPPHSICPASLFDSDSSDDDDDSDDDLSRDGLSDVVAIRYNEYPQQQSMFRDSAFELYRPHASHGDERVLVLGESDKCSDFQIVYQERAIVRSKPLQEDEFSIESGLTQSEDDFAEVRDDISFDSVATPPPTQYNTKFDSPPPAPLGKRDIVFDLPQFDDPFQTPPRNKRLALPLLPTLTPVPEVQSPMLPSLSPPTIVKASSSTVFEEMFTSDTTPKKSNVPPTKPSTQKPRVQAPSKPMKLSSVSMSSGMWPKKNVDFGKFVEFMQELASHSKSGSGALTPWHSSSSISSYQGAACRPATDTTMSYAAERRYYSTAMSSVFRG